MYVKQQFSLVIPTKGVAVETCLLDFLECKNMWSSNDHHTTLKPKYYHIIK